MNSIKYQWTEGGQQRQFALVYVQGTHETPYVFGDKSQPLSIEVRDFYIGTVPVTQGFWSHIADRASVCRQESFRMQVI